MGVAEFITWFRFEAFPFLPESEKRRPIRQLMEIDVEHPHFQHILRPFLMRNQFVGFCKMLNRIFYEKHLFCPLDIQADKELIEELFWEESSPPLAQKLLAVLLRFPLRRYEIPWRIGTNLLLRSRTTEEKECTLAYMEAYMG